VKTDAVRFCSHEEGMIGVSCQFCTALHYLHGRAIAV